MRAEGPYYVEYDPNFRVAVDEQRVASINAGYRYGCRAREPHSPRPWTTGFRLLLALTAAISVQFVSVANAANVGGPPRSAESFGAIELSACKLSGVLQAARCGVLEVPENPNRPAGRQLRIGVAVIPNSCCCPCETKQFDSPRHTSATKSGQDSSRMTGNSSPSSGDCILLRNNA